jgi:diaminohydroxyphosphoribosylaminopyrimidine deaminase/5-amino-6-(5-phosphoribosylamino)uracil reductase
MAADPKSDADIGYMHAALRHAEAGWGRVHPNPLVGAVLVKNTQIIADGHHREYGGAHAEIEALRTAGEEARGATLYVTLEPCCHYGKTPPCTDAIIAAGIKRVVYGAPDPTPIAGGGAQILRQAGIEVRGGVLADQARRQNAIFFKLHERGGCYVALKLAMSLDASLTRTAGARERVTSDVAEQEVHRLRSGFDGVMIGINTARIDDPLLTVRHARPSIRPPARVVIDTHALLSPQSALVRSLDEAPVVVICGDEADTKALTSAGVGVITVPEKNGHVDLAEAFEQLAAAGIYSVFCEGGATLGAALLAEGRVDRIYAFVAPKLFGGAGTAAFPLEKGGSAPCFSIFRIAQHGEDALLILDRCLPA